MWNSFVNCKAVYKRQGNLIMIMIMIPNCTWWFLEDRTAHKLTKAKYSLAQIQICQGKSLLQNIIHFGKTLEK